MLIPSLGCLTSKQVKCFLVLHLSLSVHVFKGNIHCYNLSPLPRTMLHEIVTTLSIVYLQCAVMLRKYTVIKHQKEAFGKSPSMVPNTVDAWEKLVPYSPLTSFLFPCQSVGEYVPF